MFTSYLMPDLIIKKVEAFGAGKQDSFNFAGCNVAFFEWNNEVDALNGKGLVKEDIVFYPYISTEFLGVALMRHITPIKEEFETRGHVKNATACNAILDWLPLQEWMHVQYLQTQIRSMTLATTTTT
jgi:hypothetical protein